MSDRLSEIVESAEAERLATGFVFTEGPLWYPDGYLLFVDIRRAQIFKLVPGEEPELIREDSGESNGMTFDAEGRVVICEMVNRRLTRMEEDGSYTVIADSSEGKRLNRPNDVVLKSDGSLFFTNPGRDRLDPADVDLQFNSVHRIRPNGEVELVVPFEYPNGIAFSPYESVLYVANTRPGAVHHGIRTECGRRCGGHAALRGYAVGACEQRGAGRDEGGCGGARVLHGGLVGAGCSNRAAS